VAQSPRRARYKLLAVPGGGVPPCTIVTSALRRAALFILYVIFCQIGPVLSVKLSGRGVRCPLRSRPPASRLLGMLCCSPDDACSSEDRTIFRTEPHALIVSTALYVTVTICLSPDAGERTPLSGSGTVITFRIFVASFDPMMAEERFILTDIPAH
jgi:hypothetical protein